MRIRKTHKTQVLKSILPDMFRSFCVITTFLVILNGLFALFLSPYSVIYTSQMLVYPFVVFVAALSGLVYVVFEATSRAGAIALRVLQLFITAVVVLGLAHMLGGGGWNNLLLNAILFILLYQISILANAAHQHKLANDINARLKQFHDENATHEG